MKQLFIIAAILFTFQTAFAQIPADSSKTTKDSVAATPAPAASQPRTRRDTRPMKERIDFGFGSAFWITPNQTYAEIAPVIAYRFPKALITGMGYRYIYRHSRVYGK